jgi:hypothetical protein
MKFYSLLAGLLILLLVTSSAYSVFAHPWHGDYGNTEECHEREREHNCEYCEQEHHERTRHQHDEECEHEHHERTRRQHRELYEECEYGGGDKGQYRYGLLG